MACIINESLMQRPSNSSFVAQAKFEAKKEIELSTVKYGACDRTELTALLPHC